MNTHQRCFLHHEFQYENNIYNFIQVYIHIQPDISVLTFTQRIQQHAFITMQTNFLTRVFFLNSWSPKQSHIHPYCLFSLNSPISFQCPCQYQYQIKNGLITNCIQKPNLTPTNVNNFCILLCKPILSHTDTNNETKSECSV